MDFIQKHDVRVFLGYAFCKYSMATNSSILRIPPRRYFAHLATAFPAVRDEPEMILSRLKRPGPAKIKNRQVEKNNQTTSGWLL